MSLKPTPGPWTFDGKYIYSNSSNSETPLVRLHPGAPDSEANARLIAAAPDLLEACKMALEMCKCSIRERESGHLLDCRVPSLEAAIAKAEGR